MGEANQQDRITIDALFTGYPFPNFLEPIEERAREFEELHPRYRIKVGSFYFQNLGEEISKATLEGRPRRWRRTTPAPPRSPATR